MKRSLKGFVALLVTTLIWGSAFVAQTSASDTVGAFAFNAGRALFATVFLSLFIFIRSKFSYGYKAPKQYQLWSLKIIHGIRFQEHCFLSPMQGFFPAASPTLFK